ncbi:MAG: Rieske (2Fe-2S) protein [Alphaproteobacteria bacterium]|nr:Rieske (2Fe-2S) protein [Alphaproteobacteria bacterium]
MPTPEWQTAFPLSALDVGAAKLATIGGRKVAVFRTAPDALYAIDNACPHEGYPLIQGDRKDCTLTCIWHNFKFDLRSGACLKGDEDVRTYAVRVADGQVQIDATEPDLSAQIPRIFESLEAALLDARVGQACRDATRLLQAGLKPEAILAWVAAFDARYAEYGVTHALPVAVDAAVLARRLEGPEATYAIAQALELAAETNVRRPVRPVPAPEAPPSDPDAAFALLRQRVEDEDAEGAEALVRGAVAAGVPLEQVLGWTVRLCSDHFLDFGHALIYTAKSYTLMPMGGASYAEDLLGALVFRVVNGTREDLLPKWARWRKRFAALEPELPALHARQLAGGPPYWDRTATRRAILDGGPAEALDAVVARLQEGVPVVDLVGLLSACASARMLGFDPAIDADPGVQEGWLDVTHLLTFCNAVRRVAERVQHPEVLRLLFQAVRFVNHARPLDRAVGGGARSGVSGTPAELVAAIRAGDPERAEDLCVGLLRDETPGLRAALLDLPLQDLTTRPIVTAHVIKTTIAAFEEADELAGEPDAALPVRAVARWLASPVDQRFLRSRVHDAIGFVVEGRIPRTLT